MLAIRLQRVGRKGNAAYRLIVQEAQKNPSSGRVVAFLGSYNPHTKESNIKYDVAQKFLDNGAQPSPRAVKLLQSAKLKLPAWVKAYKNSSKSIKNIEKLRKNKPAQKPKEEAVEAPVEAEPKAETEVSVDEVLAEAEADSVVLPDKDVQ